MEWIRSGVRTLVEFSLHGDNIYPHGTPLKAMMDGGIGHKARQALLAGGWQIEAPVELEIPVEEDEWGILLTGRMDAFLDGDIPRVEEMKLCSPKSTPVQAEPAHMAQAVCYGAMLCRLRGLERVDVHVTYVDIRGSVRADFGGEMTGEECEERFLELLEPYARRIRVLRQHERARDASLQALRFPYDSYRAGQREMAVQVYTAVRLQRRLFAGMPTGTGKSVAALFPALKAMGAGLTERIYYLTARTTQRQGAQEALERMRRQPLHLWTLTLDAKDKQCPEHTVCHPDFCPRAAGHFLRDNEAIEQLLREDDWTPERIRAAADEYQLCPFELSLSLAELADLTVCDYNYALDPAVHIQRIFDRNSDVTLLIDEAHHLPDRVREMLSGAVDGGRLRRLRSVVGKYAGRRHALYKALTAVLRALEDLPVPEDAEEGRLKELPLSLKQGCLTLAEAFSDLQGENFPWEEVGERLSDTVGPLLGFVRAVRKEEGEYAFLWQGRSSRAVTAFALDVGAYFAQTTQRMRGVVCFSATMDPLPDMRRLLGGDAEDACFEMPSPFPRENLLVLQRDADTRYPNREASIPLIVRMIETMVNAHEGRYIAFFPSFAMLRQADEKLPVPHQTQRSSMTQEEREAFLAPYRTGSEPVLSLCVLGGIFSEGIDLPGRCLDGVCVAGIGLPQVNLFQETLRGWYQEKLGDGFRYAYLLPGLQKVAQAVGRVIRTETDRGIALLLDDRYRQTAVRTLLPPHWDVTAGSPEELLERFWKEKTGDCL